MIKEFKMVSLFETFIKDTVSGKRRQVNGKRIKPQTAANYKYVLKLLNDYEQQCGRPLLIKTGLGNNERLLLRERKLWRGFYRHFSDFLFYRKHCFDNYAGSIFKNIKCFLRYMRNEKLLAFPDFYDNCYIRQEDIRIITLLPERFCFLVSNKEFEQQLSNRLRIWKDVFVFGCTAALRFSDLMNLHVRDIEFYNGSYFLYYRSLKTDTPVNIKLPQFAVEIFNHYSNRKRASSKLFPQICLSQFNKDIRNIVKLAGWCEPVGKFRNREGEPIERGLGKCRVYRFCDLVTSHVMRRTGITVLLMMGMPEYIVRKISGHAAHSKSFFRYVNFAQSFITDEIDKVYSKLHLLYSGAGDE
jgi:integrase